MQGNYRSSIFFCALGVLIVAGCVTIEPKESMVAKYKSALVQVDRPEATKERYGSVVTVKPEPDNRYVYEDNLFRGVFYITESRIKFALTNQTDHSIKIIWNEAAYIDPDGKTGRVAHDGVKYSDRNAAHPPSIIPSRTSLSDFAIPTDHVHYRKGYYGRSYSRPGQWEELRLIQPISREIVSTDSTAKQTFESEVEANEGKRFGLLLPLEIEGVVNEYTFWFAVQDALVVKQGE